MTRPKPTHRASIRPGVEPQAALDFPLPAGPRPQLPDGASNEDARVFVAALAQWSLARCAHFAVHTNHPEARASMLQHVRDVIVAGAELDPIARRWLLYVLAELEQRGAIPHAGRGAARNPRRQAEERGSLASFVIAHAGEPVEAMLRTAGEGLGMSFEKARALYYSEGFEDALAVARLSKQRGVIK